MADKLVFKSLYGAEGHDPFCYLLKVADATILLDCGWNDDFDEALLQPLAEVLPTVNLVLLSFPDMDHMGALPWVCQRLRPGVAIYGTFPVAKLGQMMLYDMVVSKQMDGPFTAYTLDDVDAVFEKRFQFLKYSQSLSVQKDGKLLFSLTPYAAGRTLGGTCWRINYRGTDDILYAVDFNHKSDRHLVGAREALTMLSTDKEKRPALVIMDTSTSPPGVATTNEKQRDAEFLETITTTLRRGGNVLIPVDPTGRVQELLLMLNNHWKGDRLLWQYKIVLLHHMSANIIHFTRCMIEWMHHDVIRSFDRNLNNPFQLRHVHTAHNLRDLDSLLHGDYGPSPTVVLASDRGMNCGFAKALMIKWASRSENTLVIVDRCREGSIAAQMLQRPPSIEVRLPVIERLEGEELASYQEKTERDRRKAVEEEEYRRQAKELVGTAMGVSFSDDHDDPARGPHGGDATSATSVKTKTRKRKRTVAYYSKPKFLMFGFAEPEKHLEEYGLPLLEGECMDITKLNFQQQKGKLQGLVAKDGGGKGGELERWGYFDGVYMTESEAQLRVVEKDPEGEGVPTKLTVKDRTVEVRWQVKAINMDGRSDSKNRRALLSLLAPRRLILVHGSPESTEEVGRHASKMGEVFNPADGEVVEVSLDTKMFDMAMDQALLANLRTKQVGDYEVAFVDAEVAGENVPGKEEDGVKVLRRRSDAAPRAQPPLLLSLGDVLLTDESIQKELGEAGVTAEFRVDSEGARLICNGKIVIRRTKDSGICLEGPLCDDYFKVRKVVYARFTTV